MAYYRECPRCGAALDPGEVCRCETAQGARLEAVSPPVPARIDSSLSRAAKEYEIDRMLAALARERAEARREKWRQRRKHRR